MTLRTVSAWVGIVAAVAVVGFSAWLFMTRSDRPRPTPPPAPLVSYCDHGYRVWPGTGVAPAPDCPR